MQVSLWLKKDFAESWISHEEYCPKSTFNKTISAENLTRFIPYFLNLLLFLLLYSLYVGHGQETE